MASPLAYFLTWTTYATWLPGDDRGSTDHARADAGPRHLQVNPTLEQQMKLKALPAIRLDQEARSVVESAIRCLAGEKRWRIHALNVRSNHVHLVVTGAQSPERVMVACKAAATKRLRQMRFMAEDSPVWTRHGSTRWINNEDSLEAAVRYTLEQQDNPARFGEQGSSKPS
jgi:REP element-mobilizing transposase RayT